MQYTALVAALRLAYPIASAFVLQFSVEAFDTSDRRPRQDCPVHRL
jgi:hypothetical protein